MNITQIDTQSLTQQTHKLIEHYNRSSFTDNSKQLAKDLNKSIEAINQLKEQATSIIRHTSDNATMKENIAKLKDLKSLHADLLQVQAS